MGGERPKPARGWNSEELPIVKHLSKEGGQPEKKKEIKEMRKKP